MKHITWKQYLEQKPENAVVILPDFWWFRRLHHYGRSGHSFVCPFSYTLMLWGARLQGKSAYWVAHIPDWFEHDGRKYDPATPTIFSKKTGQPFVESLKIFKYTAPIEIWLHRMDMRLVLWLFKLTDIKFIRKPLGKPVEEDLSKLEYHRR